METEQATRYRSRVLREFKSNHKNPFRSPPSSTGSHGTVSPTETSLFTVDVEGDSTRRLNDDILRSLAPSKLAVNWEAAHRKWPQYYSMPRSRKETVDDDSTTERPSSSKENRAPFRASTDDTTQSSLEWTGSKRTRSQMQPRADNESDLSILLKAPSQKALAREDAKIEANETMSPVSLDKLGIHTKPSYLRSRRRSSVAEAVAKLRQSASNPVAKDAPRQIDRAVSSPEMDMSSAKSSLTAVHYSPKLNAPSPQHRGSHVPSFFMPDVSHLGDFVTGTLRFTGSLKNGVPILVKQGKVHDKYDSRAAVRHGAVDSIKIPQEEEKIFVSMDMIREEVVSLQEHHHKIQEYALSLQQQVDSLEQQLEIAGKPQGMTNILLKERTEKFDSTQKQLKEHLHKTQQQLTSSNIEKDSLVTERDRVLTKLQDACEDISKLTRKLSQKDRELEHSESIRSTNEELRHQVAHYKQMNSKLETENAELRFKRDSARKDLGFTKEGFDEAKIDLGKMEIEMGYSRGESDCLRQQHQAALAKTKGLRADNEFLTKWNHELAEDKESAWAEVDLFAKHERLNEEKIESLSKSKKNLTDKVKGLEVETGHLRHEVASLKNAVDFYRNGQKGDFSARMDDLRGQFDQMRANQASVEVTENVSLQKDKHSAPMDLAFTEEIGFKDMTAPTFTDTQTHNFRHPSGGHKVAFDLPAKPSTKPATTSNSRRSASRGSRASVDYDADSETTGQQSTGTDDQVELSVPVNVSQPQPAPKILKSAVKHGLPTRRASEPDLASNVMASDFAKNRRSLSADGQRIAACSHDLQNCTICARILPCSAAEVSSGKKRVTVQRPVPVSEREGYSQDLTMRPAQSPGYALAIVIKSLQDESKHLQEEMSLMQQRYNEFDKSKGKSKLMVVTRHIRHLQQQLQAKDNQIYNLYDVLEGQKAADQDMEEDELEMTLKEITGMSLADILQFNEENGYVDSTWEGGLDASDKAYIMAGGR